MKIYGLITARSGSKGIKHKNLRTINYKTLLRLAAELALDCDFLTQSFISTDCEIYEKLGKKYGLSSLGLRAKNLSHDKATSIDVLNDFIASSDFIKANDLIVLLQPTSPIRDVSLVSLCVESSKKNFETSITVGEIDEPHPMKTVTNRNGTLRPTYSNDALSTPRQLLPKFYQLTGAVYAIPVAAILEKKIYTAEPNFIIQEEFVNIDSPRDLFLARYLYGNRR